MNEMLVFGTLSTINAIAMSYHIDQQGIIPDCAYNMSVNHDPLNLPPYTIRLLYRDGVTPEFYYGTAVQVSNSPNVWDLTYNNRTWGSLLITHLDLLKVLGANTTDVINMSRMFWGCNNLNSVSLFDTSNVTDMSEMFNGCRSLPSVLLFNTSKVKHVQGMFYNCRNVESGALALYNQLITQTVPPIDYDHTFYNCGINTTTGAEELAQIPDDWK